MEKLRLLVEIHQLHAKGFKVAAIARKLGISRNTVYKYLKMNFEEAVEWNETLKTRTKKLDPFKERILSWLKENPDMSAAQVEDWLKEENPDFEISASTVRKYVSDLRDFYSIPKDTYVRTFEAIEELPMGQQIQVDWGEITLKNRENKKVKLYFITFVLSHSRYKYVEWLDRPFTTREAIRCHENAFAYFGGVPKEMVYDQDHLITVSENAGDIHYTQDFQAYKQQRNFNIYLCRKEDPQSKGKIENVVRFVKRNFANHRTFTNLKEWNEKCLAWLKRTGNYKVHETTKKRPVEVFALEKQHLKPVLTFFSFENKVTDIITRTVHKDNIIKYKSNRYSVPLGTYRPRGDNRVYLEIVGEELIIRRETLGEILARHRISQGKGELIKNRHHSRDRSKGIQAYKETIIRQFGNQEKAEKFIDEIKTRYPRYIRDQLQVIQIAIHQYPTEINQALDICMKDYLWSANDLRDVAQYLTRMKKEKSPKFSSKKMLDSLALKATAETRSIDVYLKILGGD